jgi:broad specificity phosphatase PhoE
MPPKRSRYILIVRHGTKKELSNRYDLPICSKNYCQDKNTFSKLKTLKKSPNKKVVYASPFLRTKQTAGRMAKKLEYTKPIYIEDGLGEAYSQVSKQLSKCGENRYRVASSSPKRIDKCMKNVKSIEKSTLYKATSELSRYKFKKSPKRSPRRHVKSKKNQDQLFKKSVENIMKKNPNKDIVIITHGRNVQKSLQNLSPRRGIPRISLLPPTCGSILYQQTGKNVKIVNSKGIWNL